MLNAVVTHEPPWYVARLLGVDVAAQGATPEEATDNLRSAITGGSVAVPAEAAVLRPIDVPDGDVAPQVPAAGFDRDDVIRLAEAAGWTTEPRDGLVVLRCPDRAHLVSLPVAAVEVAPAVYRMIVGEIAAAAAAVPVDRPALLRDVDAIFARNPVGEDSTRLVREQRDAV